MDSLMLSVRALPAVCALAAAAAADVTPGLYAVDNIGHDLLYINPATGEGSRIGNTGLFSTIGLAFDPAAEVLYLAGTASGGEPSLYTIDPETAETSLIGSLGTLRGLAGLAIDGDGGLRAIQRTGSGGGAAGDIYDIDPQTGAATHAGNTGTGSFLIYDASYDPFRDRIWLTSASSGDVYTVYPHDGQPAQFEFNTRVGNFGMEALAVTGGGEMLGVMLETGTDSLYGINKNTGEPFLRGDTGFDQIVAMTWVIPAPGAAGLLAAWLPIALRRRR